MPGITLRLISEYKKNLRTISSDGTFLNVPPSIRIYSKFSDRVIARLRRLNCIVTYMPPVWGGQFGQELEVPEHMEIVFPEKRSSLFTNESALLDGWEETCKRLTDKNISEDKNLTAYLQVIFEIFVHTHFAENEKKFDLDLHSYSEGEAAHFIAERLKKLPIDFAQIPAAFFGYGEREEPYLKIKQLSNINSSIFEKEFKSVENFLLGISGFSEAFPVLLFFLPINDVVGIVASYYFTTNSKENMQKAKNMSTESISKLAFFKKEEKENDRNATSLHTKPEPAQLLHLPSVEISLNPLDFKKNELPTIFPEEDLKYNEAHQEPKNNIYPTVLAQSLTETDKEKNNREKEKNGNEYFDESATQCASSPVVSDQYQHSGTRDGSYSSVLADAKFEITGTKNVSINGKIYRGARINKSGSGTPILPFSTFLISNELPPVKELEKKNQDLPPTSSIFGSDPTNEKSNEKGKPKNITASLVQSLSSEASFVPQNLSFLSLTKENTQSVIGQQTTQRESKTQPSILQPLANQNPKTPKADRIALDANVGQSLEFKQASETPALDRQNFKDQETNYSLPHSPHQNTSGTFLLNEVDRIHEEKNGQDIDEQLVTPIKTQDTEVKEAVDKKGNTVSCKKAVTAEISPYSYYSCLKFSIFGHHHGDRAAAVGNAINSARSDEQIREILQNQYDLFYNPNKVAPTSHLDKRYSLLKRLTNKDKGGYSAAIEKAVDAYNQQHATEPSKQVIKSKTMIG